MKQMILLMIISLSAYAMELNNLIMVPNDAQTVKFLTSDDNTSYARYSLVRSGMEVPPSTYVQIIVDGEYYSYKTEDGMHTVQDIEFLGNGYLIINEGSSTRSWSKLVELKNRVSPSDNDMAYGYMKNKTHYLKFTVLGGGVKFVKKGKYKGLFMSIYKTYLYDKNGNSQGATWYQRYLNFDGDVVYIDNIYNFVSKHNKHEYCVPVRRLIHENTKYPKLKTPLDTCVTVER